MKPTRMGIYMFLGTALAALFAAKAVPDYISPWF
jgi:hypothetical protein